MDWKIVTIEGKQVLLERIDADDQKGGWHVMISVYRAIEDRYDEWVTLGNPQAARSFIEGFDSLQTRQFLTRAEQAKRKPAKVNA